MAAISKAWVTIGDGAVDPDSPGDATLMTGIRDNLVHLREWIGASFFAGAVQDHNHDGSNSALIQIGPNLIRNGSFEDGETGWTITDYSGGSHVVQSTVRHHGEKALSFTSTVLANGGGDALSNEFIPVTEGHVYRVDYLVSASAINISSRSQIIWYDAAKSQISAVNIYDLTNTPTSRSHYSSPVVAPANARFARLKLIGGVPGAGSATGTIYFDGALFSDPPTGLVPLMRGSVASAATLDIVMTTYTGYRNKVLVLESFVPVSDAVRLLARVSTNGGSSYDGTSGNYRYAKKQHTSTPASGDAGGTDHSIEIMEAVGNSGGAEQCNAVVKMFDTPSTTFNPQFLCEAVSNGGAPQTIVQVTAAERLAAQDTDAFRVVFSAGNIASGKWALYGWI